MRRSFCALLLIILITFSPGCWSRRELTDLAVVAGTGVDRAKEEKDITLTVQIIKPAGVKAPKAAEEGEGVLLVSSTGRTLFQAVRNLSMQSSRRPFFSHNKVIVVGEELARAGIGPVVDFFTRRRELRRRMWFLVAKGQAKDVMEASGGLEEVPADKIHFLMMAAQKDFSTTSVVNLNELVKRLSSKTTSAVAPGIEIIESDKGKEKQIRVTGTAVFKKDQMVGWLNTRESRGLLWTTGKVERGVIIVGSPGDETEEVSLEIMRADSKIIPSIQDGQVYITVKVREEGHIIDQSSTADLTRPENIASLERRKATVIKNEIRAALKKAQFEFNADIFGFGEAVQRKFPEYWRDIEDRWDEVFPTVEVTLQVDAKIHHVGLTTKPVSP